MDYEKKYNEALAWMRELYPGLHGATKEDAEHYFPELRESEDERIRKWLADYFSSIKKTVWIHRDITCEQILAWLEKQKEQKPVECSEVELEFRGERVKVKRPFFRDDKGRGYSTTKQDEEVAWNALRAWCEKKGISLYDLYPKAEWSEEDKKIAYTILNLLCSQVTYVTGQGTTSGKQYPTYAKERDWFEKRLKSLRPSWKPSDQDELMKLKYAGTSTKLD